MKNSFDINISKLNECYKERNQDFFDRRITSVSTIDAPADNGIMFVTKEKWLTDYEHNLSRIKNSLIILENGIVLENKDIAENNQIYFASNARLEFAKILAIIERLCMEKKEYIHTAEGAVVGLNTKIGRDTSIEPFVFIDNDVSIGNHCIIKTGAKIRENVVIGDYCIIGENCVLGGPGLGVEKDEGDRNYRIPHVGGVVIDDYVEIGALTSICSGTINPTIIEKYVFIDDKNHIAHNCMIGQGTMTSACVQISGSARIGKDCFIAPNSTIRNGIQIGDHVFIGQATSVTKDVPSNITVAGNPNQPIEELKKWLKIKHKLINESTY